MLTLCIETASSLCAAGLFQSPDPLPGSPDTGHHLRGHTLLATARHDGGRAHAEHLLPLIASLPGGGRADRILVDCGPGSFTGVRIGLATARALGLGWGIPVHGFSSLAVLAARYADWRNAHPERLSIKACWSVLEAGHGEVFIQPFQPHADGRVHPLAEVRSLHPRAAARLIANEAIVGQAGSTVIPADSHSRWLDVPIDIDPIDNFPGRIRWLPPVPIYARAPDAQLPNRTNSSAHDCPNSDQLI